MKRLVSVVLGVGVIGLSTMGCGDDTEGSGGSGGGTSTSASAGGGAGGTSAATTTTSSGGEGGAGGGGAPCAGLVLPAMDDDTSVRGPFDVGAVTADVDGLRVEVLYPAPPGAGGEPKRYDVREHLPESERAKIADEDTAIQTCDCFDGLPVDDGAGPFPVVIFVHGTAGFRTQSLELQTHWATRGFVVIAADHPGLQLEDLLTLACGQGNTPRDLDGDLATLVAAIEAPTGDLAFLDGHVDPTAIAMIGHSAGGAAIAGKGDVARVLVPMAAGGVEEGSALESTLVLGAVEDQVVEFASQEEGYASSPSPRRLVGLSPAGHLAFSSLCSLRNAAGEDIVTIGENSGVCGLSLADGLFDCADTHMPDPTAWSLVNEATSAVLEETLHCRPDRAAWIAGIAGRHEEIVVFEEAL